jgi:hypothetical protein
MAEAEPMTMEKAKAIIAGAKEAWSAAETRDAAAEVIRNFGKKIGYKPLIKIILLGQDEDKVLGKIYGPKEE